jgi:hypothetical protein
MQEADRIFDLEPHARAAEASRLSGRALALGFSAFLVLVVAFELVRHLVGGSLPWYDVGIYSAVLLVAAYGLWIALHDLSPRATRLELGPVDLRFVYRSGKVRTLSWADSNFELHLRDYRPWARIQKTNGDRALLFAQAAGEPRSALSPEAFDAILDAARSHGFAVTAREPRELFEKRRELTIRPSSEFG